MKDTIDVIRDDAYFDDCGVCKACSLNSISLVERAYRAGIEARDNNIDAFWELLSAYDGDYVCRIKTSNEASVSSQTFVKTSNEASVSSQILHVMEPIVRCKDCKSCTRYRGNDSMTCSRTGFVVSPNDYCSDAVSVRDSNVTS